MPLIVMHLTGKSSAGPCPCATNASRASSASFRSETSRLARREGFEPPTF